jgi:hypothetical protein
MSWDIWALQVHKLSMTILRIFTFVLFEIMLLWYLTEVPLLKVGSVIKTAHVLKDKLMQVLPAKCIVYI